MKYSFSEIWRFGDWSFEKEYKGKYGCQVFNEDGTYVTCLICDTIKEVYEQIKEWRNKK